MKKYFCVLGLSCVVAFFILIGGETKAQECSAPAPVCAAKASVVKIASFEPIGSAVIINDGVLVTNRHMVADNQHVELTLPDGAKFKASVVPSDYTGDLVLLLVEGAKIPSSIKAMDADISGDLYVIGFDVGRQAIRVYAPGQLIAPKANTPFARLHHNARSLPGNSGGALINADGHLVGVVTSGGEGRNEAIPISALERLHAHSGPDKLLASKEIGQMYRQCVERLDSLRGTHGPLEPSDAIMLSDACVATNNRQLIDLAGQGLGTRRDTERAVALLEKSYAIDPNAPNTIISLAIAYHIAGQYTDEIPVLYRGLELMPTEPQLLRLALQAGIWGKDQALADMVMKQIETVMPEMAPAARNFYNAAPPAPRLRPPG